MRRIACPENQGHLFPMDVLILAGSHQSRTPTPLPALLVDESDEVSMGRAKKILGLEQRGVRSLIDLGCIVAIRKSSKGVRYISYKSIVEHCDKLRIKYAIDDHRKPLRGHSTRYPDDQILPFPLSDTIYTPEVAEGLRFSQQRVRQLCEEGSLCSYKLHESQSWRISRTRFLRYRERLEVGKAASRTSPRK